MLRSLIDSEFHTEVREHLEPIIIMFTGSWCQPCQKMKPTFEEMASQMGDDIRFAYMDAEEGAQTMSEFNIRTLPSLALFVDGMVREIYSGTMNKSDLRYWINSNI